MDLFYTTIPIFGGKRRLYRENYLAYMISNKDNPKNHSIYIFDTDMGSSMFLNDLCPQENVSRSSKSARDEVNQ